MKSFKIALLGLCALFVASCGSDSASIKGVLAGAPEKDIIVKLLEVNTYKILDTLKTDTKGAFSYKVDVKKGDPEFVYLFYGDTQISSLLLEAGDKVSVSTDTLGHCTVEGSDESVRLQEVEKRFAEFINASENMETVSEFYQNYVQYYRGSLKYLAQNPYSLTVIPVLYQNITPEFPIFGQSTDALHFRKALDSLKTVYPDSKYVKILENEAVKRENVMILNNQIKDLSALNFPEIKSKDINGQDVRLSEVDAKVIMVQFWTVQDASNKIFNLDTLIPIYEKYHKRGLEIFAVSLDSDKASWATVVRKQNLPWINVNDGLGVYSSVVANYNIQSLPQIFLIVNGEIYTKAVEGDDEFKKLLDKVL